MAGPARCGGGGGAGDGLGRWARRPDRTHLAFTQLAGMGAETVPAGHWDHGPGQPGGPRAGEATGPGSGVERAGSRGPGRDGVAGYRPGAGGLAGNGQPQRAPGGGCPVALVVWGLS